MKLLHLNFIPRSADCGLLALRLWFGIAMLRLHGWSKLTGFTAMAEKFPDPLHLGSQVSLGLTIFAEVVCSVLIIFGVFTRMAAIVGMINMGVAFWIVLGHHLSAGSGGELSLHYFAAYAVLLCAGAGKWSVDARIGAKG